MGLTGNWWDWQNHDVKPDLMTFGKKSQVCGFAAAARIDEIDSVFKVGSRISSTFEGNIVDMVRCTRIIEVIESDNLVKNAETMGKYHGTSCWRSWRRRTPRCRLSAIAVCGPPSTCHPRPSATGS